MCMRSNDIYQEIEYEERYSKIFEQGLAPRFTYFSCRQKNIFIFECLAHLCLKIYIWVDSSVSYKTHFNI